MKNFLYITILILVASFSFSTSFHSINIDGLNDFDVDTERFQTTSGTDLYCYISWDASNLYLAFSGNTPSGSIAESNRVFHIY